MLKNKDINGADWLFLILIIVHVGASYLVGYVLKDSNFTMNQSIIFSQMLIAIPSIGYLLVKRVNPVKFITFRKVDIPTILMTMLFVVLIMPLVTVVNAISMLFTENTVQTMSGEIMQNSFWVNILLMAVLPAFFEEFVFRGVLYQSYRKKSIIYGAILSGILFGLMHLNFNQFSYAAVLGILFAFLIEATGSIWCSMLGHFMINANSVIMLKFSEKMFASMKNMGNDVGMDYNQIMESAMDAQSLRLVIIMYSIIAVITTMLALGIWIWLAKRNNNLYKFKCFSNLDTNNENNELVNCETEKEARPIRVILLLGIVACMAVMIYSETI